MSIDLVTNIRDAMFLALSKIKLSEGSVVKWGGLWSDPSAHCLNLLIMGEFTSEKELLRELNSVLKNIGRKMYEQHKKGEYPDHTHSPQALAYAILNNEFTDAELKNIRYDHRETEQEFVKLYGIDDFPLHVLNQLRAEREPLPANTDNDVCCEH